MEFRAGSQFGHEHEPRKGAGRRVRLAIRSSGSLRGLAHFFLQGHLGIDHEGSAGGKLNHYTHYDLLTNGLLEGWMDE